MRGLKQNFFDCLQHGFLKPLITRVKEDKDLDLQIRDNYINVYFKGNSLLKLSPIKDSEYKVELHQKFRTGFDVPKELYNVASTNEFLINTFNKRKYYSLW